MSAKIFETPDDFPREIQLCEEGALKIPNAQQVIGLWARALSDSSGNDNAAKALYIKLNYSRNYQAVYYSNRLDR